jgi:hypothetical protein
MGVEGAYAVSGREGVGNFNSACELVAIAANWLRLAEVAEKKGANETPPA